MTCSAIVMPSIASSILPLLVSRASAKPRTAFLLRPPDLAAGSAGGPISGYGCAAPATSDKRRTADWTSAPKPGRLLGPAHPEAIDLGGPPGADDPDPHGPGLDTAEYGDVEHLLP